MTFEHYPDGVQWPVVLKLDDGRWSGWWPEHGKRFFGASREELMQKLPRRVVTCPACTDHLPDGTWVAFYPSHGYRVSGPTKEAAIQSLRAERMRRIASDPAYLELIRKYEAQPPPGYEVRFITTEEADAEMFELHLKGANVSTYRWQSESKDLELPPSE